MHGRKAVRLAETHEIDWLDVQSSERRLGDVPGEKAVRVECEDRLLQMYSKPLS